MKTNIRQAVLQDTVKANGKNYRVTAIADGAFKDMKKLATFNTGKKLKTIGKSAFENCAKLSIINVQSANIMKIGKNAFNNIHKKPTLVLSDKLESAYIKKLLKLLSAGGLRNVK